MATKQTSLSAADRAVIAQWCKNPALQRGYNGDFDAFWAAQKAFDRAVAQGRTAPRPVGA